MRSESFFLAAIGFVHHRGAVDSRLDEEPRPPDERGHVVGVDAEAAELGERAGGRVLQGLGDRGVGGRAQATEASKMPWIDSSSSLSKSP